MTDYKSDVSKYDRIAYYLTLMAIAVQFYLWVMHISDTDAYGEMFSYIAFYEFIFAFIGFLLYDPINHRGFRLKKRAYSKLSGWLILRIIIIMGGMAIIQAVFQFIPLTVTDPEIALAIVFAGVSEENFFRGVLVSMVMLLFANVKGYKIPIPVLKRKREISVWVLFGIIITAILFAGIHINYYSNPNLLLGTFACGLWLGITYWYWEDLTANIMAHFLLNLIVVWRTFFIINF